LLRTSGDLAPEARIGPVTGGWLRMGGTGTPPAAGNVLLAGDAAGLINPLQGEGIGPGMVSARLAAEALLAGPGRAAAAYTEALTAAFGPYLPGAAALQATLLHRPRAVPARCGCHRARGPPALAYTWSLYWNGLVDGASPRPAAWAAAAVQQVASRAGRRWPANSRDLDHLDPGGLDSGRPEPGGPDSGGGPESSRPALADEAPDLRRSPSADEVRSP
jgi:hypothetical protein